MRLISILAASAAFTALSGCTPPAPGNLDVVIDQASLCEVSAWGHDEVGALCSPGQKVAFLPRSFGNEQLPVIFAAVNCDLRYSVALTTGAVTCIYGPITPAMRENAKKSPTPSS